MFVFVLLLFWKWEDKSPSINWWEWSGWGGNFHEKMRIVGQCSLVGGRERTQDASGEVSLSHRSENRWFLEMGRMAGTNLCTAAGGWGAAMAAMVGVQFQLLVCSPCDRQPGHQPSVRVETCLSEVWRARGRYGIVISKKRRKYLQWLEAKVGFLPRIKNKTDSTLPSTCQKAVE